MIRIVYDSIFGNTEQVARAIAQAIGPAGEVELLKVAAAKPEELAGLKLLVVGSPTRAFRATASVNEFLSRIPAGGLRGVKVAAFDTGFAPKAIGSPVLRVMARIFGYAAKPIADRLVKKGGEPVAPPEGFFVTGTEGPLAEGELQRAADWAKRLVGPA